VRPRFRGGPIDAASVRSIRLTASMAPTDESHGQSGEHVSPELVLVDPDLARRARERLGDEWRQAERERRGASEMSDAATAATPTHQPTEDRRRVPAVERRFPAAADSSATRRGPEAPVRSREASADWRRRRGVIFASVAVAVVAAIAGTLIASPSRFGSWLSRDEAVTPSVTAPRKRESSPRQAPSAPAGRTANRSAGAPTPAISTATSQRSDPVRVRTTGERARAFGWPPVAKADFYLVDFYRGGTKIYEARASRPRLTLPAQWTFRGRRYRLNPGHYQWAVRAVLGSRTKGRDVRVVVRAKLQVPRTHAR
jgi:hypothetical protein